MAQKRAAVSAEGSPRSTKRTRQTFISIGKSSSPLKAATRSAQSTGVQEPVEEPEANPLDDAEFFEDGGPTLRDFLNPSAVSLFSQVRVSLIDEHRVIDTGRRRFYDSEHHLLVLVFCGREGMP